MTRPESRQLAVAGLWLHLLDWGGPPAPPVVLLHDLGGVADDWRAVAGALAERFRVVAVDLRGHGESDWIDTYAPQEQADDIGELVSLLGLAPTALIGAGMGGRAAALLAARQDHLVSRVVMIDAGVVMYMPEERQAEESLLAIPRVYDTAGEFARIWWERRHAAGLTRLAEPPGDGDFWRARLRRLSAGGLAPKFDVEGYRQYRAWSPGGRSVDYHDEYDQISCPVLLVRGVGSPTLTPEHAAETVRSIPGCRLVTVSDARHDILTDNPDGLLAATLPFLLATAPNLK
ncbi:MAG: alpha/beta hydrolase [Dehalococcoidia bacterium]